jgi:hypothetical protein
MHRKTCTIGPTIRPLSQGEIDRRIDSLVDEVTGSEIGVAGAASEGQPRWISSAELVRRMRPFLVLN